MNTQLSNQLKKYAIQMAIVTILIGAVFAPSAGGVSARFAGAEKASQSACSGLVECGYIMMHMPQRGDVSIPVTGGITKTTVNTCRAGANLPNTTLPLYVGLGYELTFNNCGGQLLSVNR